MPLPTDTDTADALVGVAVALAKPKPGPDQEPMALACEVGVEACFCPVEPANAADAPRASPAMTPMIFSMAPYSPD